MGSKLESGSRGDTPEERAPVAGTAVCEEVERGLEAPLPLTPADPLDEIFLKLDENAKKYNVRVAHLDTKVVAAKVKDGTADERTLRVWKAASMNYKNLTVLLQKALEIGNALNNPAAVLARAREILGRKDLKRIEESLAIKNNEPIESLTQDVGEEIRGVVPGLRGIRTATPPRFIPPILKDLPR